jgi:hypothetical protein
MSLVGCCCLVHTIKRGQLREQYGLVQDFYEDCFVTCCCPPCAICQETREMKVRGMINIFSFIPSQIICLYIGYPPPPRIIIHQPALSLSSLSDFDTKN